MDKETKFKLYAKVLADNQRIPFGKLNIEKTVNELLDIDELDQKQVDVLVEQETAKEIAELEAKKAEALAIIQEADSKLSVLKAEEITK